MIPLSDLALQAADRYGLTVDDLKGRSRKGLIVKARIEYYKLAVQSGYTREATAQFVNRTHSTVTALYNGHIKGRQRKYAWVRCRRTQFKWRTV